MTRAGDTEWLILEWLAGQNGPTRASVISRALELDLGDTLTALAGLVNAGQITRTGMLFATSSAQGRGPP